MSQAQKTPGNTLLASPLIAALWEMRSTLVSVFAFSLVINFLMLAPSLYSLQVYDRVLTSRNMTTLLMLSLITLFLFAVLSLVEWSRSRIMVRVGVRLDHALGKRLLAAAHRLNIDQGSSAGRSLLGDLSKIRYFLTGPAMLAALDAPWVPIYFVVTMMLHPWLGLIALASAVILSILTYVTELLTQHPLSRANAHAHEARKISDVNQRNGEVVEAMGMLPALTGRWQAAQDGHLYEQARASDRAAHVSSFTHFFRLLQQGLILGVGAMLAVDGSLTPGGMIAGSILASRMMLPIEQLIASWRQWIDAHEAWKRIDHALALPEPGFSGVKLPAPKGEISLENVYAGPPGSTTPTLKNITLRIPAGASVAVVGASAAGKSSLLRVLAGVWKPLNGLVRIDGADLQHWPRADLGPHIGYLPQDVELFDGTVAENICRHGELNSEAILAAAAAAGVDGIIRRLAQGYGTPVGSGGTFLSGGQRQRIGLARALYGTPALVFLDEPNANLDEAGELALDEALKLAHERGQTIVLVSHRPNAIRNCDLILMLQDGQVALFGPRDLVLQSLANASAKSLPQQPPAVEENGHAPQ